MVRFSAGEDEGEELEIRDKKRKTNQTIQVLKSAENQGEGLNEEENLRGEEKEEEEIREESSRIEQNGAVSVIIDPDVLECSLCCEPLRPPLYQCQNGHVACSVCCTRLPQDKCPTCSLSINFARCRALEKVIDSIKSSCCYSAYGCRKTLPYVEILSHQVTCTYAPSFCPLLDCIFCGSPQQVSTHFGTDHYGSAIAFQYDKQFKAVLRQDEPFVILHERHDLLFLLLNDSSIDKGNALSVACIRPSSMDSDFMYELTVSGAGSSLQLTASVTNIRKWVGVYPSNVFLLVPSNFCSTAGEIILNVCIQRKGLRP